MTYPAVAELLPHEPPMVLLDEVAFWEGDTARCRVTLRPDSMFVNAGGVRSIVALEYMAQCVGICTSLRARAKGEPLTSGYLVGAREVNLERPGFEVGDELLVEATIGFDGTELGSFDCTVSIGDEIVASGVLNVYRKLATVESGEGA